MDELVNDYMDCNITCASSDLVALNRTPEIISCGAHSSYTWPDVTSPDFPRCTSMHQVFNSSALLIYMCLQSVEISDSSFPKSLELRLDVAFAIPAALPEAAAENVSSQISEHVSRNLLCPGGIEQCDASVSTIALSGSS